MTASVMAVIGGTIVFSSFLSGIFGMAGGMILMGLLTWLLPVQAAFVTHGILQLVSNGSRAIIHRRYIKLPVLGWFALATASAALLVWALAWVPSKALVFLLLGLMPILIWLPKNWFAPDAARPGHAIGAGFLASALNLTSGVSGPLIDTVFVRTGLTRHEIIATKAAIQCLNHISKIILYGLLLWQAGDQGIPPLWFFFLAILLSLAGTTAGAWVLDRISDVNFKRWTAWIVTGIGAVYLFKAAQLLL